MVSDLYLSVAKGKLGININRWTVPVFYVDKKRVPWSEIHYKFEKKFCHPHLLKKAPIPTNAVPDPKGDAHMCIVNSDRTRCWDFWGAEKK